MTKPFKHILCGVDGSDPACRAAETAAKLAVALEADLTFVTVAREAKPDAAMKAYLEAEGLKGVALPLLPSVAEECMDIAMQLASAAGHNHPTRLIKTGEVATTLEAAVRNTGADLIVLGRHHRTNVSRAVFGSVSRAVGGACEQTLVLVP